jgi:hypothetical protein
MNWCNLFPEGGTKKFSSYIYTMRIPMKKVMKFLVISILMISLSACGKNKEPEATPTESLSMEDVHTAVVLTLTEQAAHFSPTPEPTQTITNTFTPVPTNTVQATLPVATSAQATVSNSTANGCNDAVYVSDVTIPDGTEIAPGSKFTKTWSVKNTGSCSWDTSYQLVHISGETMGASSTKLSGVINVGLSGNISVEMTAPTKAGTYYSYWKMADSAGNRFGGQMYVMIKVTGNGTVTATATKTNTTAATAAFTSTFTSVPPTDTPVPTETEVVVETTESTPATGG